MEGGAMVFSDNSHPTVSRRDFLAFAAGLVTAISLGTTPHPGAARAAEIVFPEGRCGGEKNVQKRVLVTYASKFGSTGGVADAIGKELCGKDVAADVTLVKNAPGLGSYQGIVIGSAIYRGKWMAEAVDFVKKNREALRQMQVAYFLVCITLAQQTEKNQAQALTYMDPILEAVPEVRPVTLGTFAGALNYSNLSWLNRKILKSKGSPEGDFRDWGAIRMWARESVYIRINR
jgi:menaquinone-dependent protoporphyrinogen oxidase